MEAAIAIILIAKILCLCNHDNLAPTRRSSAPREKCRCSREEWIAFTVRNSFAAAFHACIIPKAHPKRESSFAQISERHVAVVGFWRQAARVRRLRNLHSAVELFEPERRQGRSCITICVYLLILYYATIQRPNFLPPSRLMRLASLN